MLSSAICSYSNTCVFGRRALNFPGVPCFRSSPLPPTEDAWSVAATDKARRTRTLLKDTKLCLRLTQGMVTCWSSPRFQIHSSPRASQYRTDISALHCRSKSYITYPPAAAYLSENGYPTSPLQDNSAMGPRWQCVRLFTSFNPATRYTACIGSAGDASHQTGKQNKKKSGRSYKPQTSPAPLE